MGKLIPYLSGGTFIRLNNQQNKYMRMWYPPGGGGGLSIYTGRGVPQHIQKGGGVLGTGQARKRGVLGTGQVKKRGVFTAAHTCTGHICECPPPPGCGVCVHYLDKYNFGCYICVIRTDECQLPEPICQLLLQCQM